MAHPSLCRIKETRFTRKIHDVEERIHYGQEKYQEISLDISAIEQKIEELKQNSEDTTELRRQVYNKKVCRLAEMEKLIELRKEMNKLLSYEKLDFSL
jgi:hypothetical protein